MKKRILHFERQRGTFMWWILDKQTNEIDNVYIQFSLKNPLWLPKYDPMCCDGRCPLYGWLFFYFGKTAFGQFVNGKIERNPIYTNVVKTN